MRLIICSIIGISEAYFVSKTFNFFIVGILLVRLAYSTAHNTHFLPNTKGACDCVHRRCIGDVSHSLILLEWHSSNIASALLVNPIRGWSDG